MKGFQYDEKAILLKLMPERFTHMDMNGIAIKDSSKGGCLVDIGAADGVDNSNSYELINEHGWSGLLVEPHNGYFMDLLRLYSTKQNVQLANYAISSMSGRRRFFLNDQCSSLKYPRPYSIEAECISLDLLFDLYKVPPHINFMSIDCEGEDMSILKSLGWLKYKIDVVCVEHSMDKQELDGFMKQAGYRLVDRTKGNSLYENTI